MMRKFAAIVTMLVLVAAAPCFAQEQDIAVSFGLSSRGVDYYRAGKLHEAKVILERAIELDSRNADAQTYLDLVNAELRLRARGMLDTYQRSDELRRESEALPQPIYRGEYSDNPEFDRPVHIEERYEPVEEYEYSHQPQIKPQTEPRYQYPPGYSEDKIKAIANALNDNIAPGEIKGEYKMAFGVTGDDLIWKDTNADHVERNFRVIDHQFPKANTFDKRVYDRFKVVFDTNKSEEGLNFHSDITVDPWSFVGKTEKTTITGSAGDTTEIELKYWSGNRSTINETIPTLSDGDDIDIPELKVVDGRVVSTSVNDTWGESFSIPELDIDTSFQPMRELWFDYNTDSYKARAFLFGLEDQALSSDDPLGLSNHHIYWEPSPWLDEWKTGNLNSSAASFTRGQWSSDLSTFTRESEELKRLTALRGFSFASEFAGGSELQTTFATPKGLWQEYDSVNAVPGAIRIKTPINDRLTLGFIDTFRIGYEDDKADSYNNVFGVDASYDLNPTTNIVGEIAVSKSEDDRSDSTYETERNGTAAHLAVKRGTTWGDARLAFTHMDKGFDPGLASYRQTRNDQYWGRHIHFKEPIEYSRWGSDPLRYEDIEPFRIGDGVDVGRDAVNFRLEKEDALDGRMKNLIDYRYVRDSDHKYVEGVFREENTLEINPEWTSKFLFIYHDLPKTKGGIDPIIYDADTGEFKSNAAIEDGKDPSVSTYSLGVEYSPSEWDWISVFGIYENTNDSTFATNNYPRWLLNNISFSTAAENGQQIRSEVPFLYSQGFFDLPPYERFNIYRLGVSLKPLENLGIDLDYTKNDFKFAQSMDNNMNQFSTTFKYKFNPRLKGFLKYTFSRAYNLYRLNTSGDLKYEKHHNVFMELDYNVTEYGALVIQFGEGSIDSTSIPGIVMSPFGDFYPTLDTQHILRIYYHGVF